MKRVATTEHKPRVRIPDIVRIAIVAVEVPLAVIITLHVEEFAVAVRVDYIQNAFHAITL